MYYDQFPNQDIRSTGSFLVMGPISLRASNLLLIGIQAALHFIMRTALSVFLMSTSINLCGHNLEDNTGAEWPRRRYFILKPQAA
jgi:hypothetical protein